MFPKIAVMMSTYNGEKYVEEQIESIILQSDVDVHIYIRDDGSNDKTLKIVDKLRKKYVGQISISSGKNIGVGLSFWELLVETGNKYDYYSFSDQDDIWLKDKLIKAISVLNKGKKHLYCSNQICINNLGDELGYAYKTPPRQTFHNLIFANVIRGCTMVFDNFFYQLVTDIKRSPNKEIIKSRNHDFWIACVGALSDCLIYDDTATMLYRQHDNNVVGAYDATLTKKLKQKINKCINKNSRKLRSKSAIALYYAYFDYLKEDVLIQLFLNQNKFINRIKLICYCYSEKNYGKQNIFTFSLYAILGLI